eukprot:g75870.t1
MLPVHCCVCVLLRWVPDFSGGGSAVSSDVVGAGAVVTFLCCSAVSSPALAMTGVCISRENSSKVVVIVAGGDRSLKQDRCRPGRWSVLQGVHVVSLQSRML